MVGEKPEEANAHKARWKHIEKKATQKLLSWDRHQLLFTPVGVIFPAERHLIIGEVYEPVIGDGDAMGVAGKVMKNVLRTAERRFGVHDPVLAKERAKKRMEGRLLRKRLKSTWKGQMPFRNAFFSPAVNLPRNTRLSTFTGRKKA